MATILIVDDDEDIRGSIRFMLETARHRVLVATDGAEAIQCWRSLILDLTITDFAMPRMNGQELIQMVVTHQPALPIILMSCGIEEHVLLCILFHYPSVRYLPKQLVAAHLRDYVRDALT
ncbi:MAG: response regulator [Nitrospira sp.]|nr:response regulator [Nitrospira sp.]